MAHDFNDDLTSDQLSARYPHGLPSNASLGCPDLDQFGELEETFSTSASVEFMITKAMRAALGELGYSDNDIREMLPAAAHRIIAEKRRENGKAWSIPTVTYLCSRAEWDERVAGDPVLPDEPTIRWFLEIVTGHVKRAFASTARPGYLQLSRINPHDETFVTTRFKIGDIDALVQRAFGDAKNGHNVYLEGRTVSESVRGNQRGTIEDTRGVYALVVDSDADKGKAGKDIDELATLIIETSPGNKQQWFFFERAIPADQARKIGDAMRLAVGADQDTGVITQVYRIAGTPNYPGKLKQARGRVKIEATSIIRHTARVWTPEALLAEFPAPAGGTKKEDHGGNGRGSANGEARAHVLEQVRKTDVSDRSAQFHCCVLAAIAAGMTPDELEAMMREHPEGCAAKYLNKRRDVLRREIDRSWGKKADVGSSDEESAKREADARATLFRMNETYMVIIDGGRTRVLYFAPHVVHIDHVVHKRMVPTFQSFEDFNNFHANQTVPISHGKSMPLGKWWLSHKSRRTYLGITFQPGQSEVVDGHLNLWRGWGVEPKAGDWSLMRRHVFEVLASGDAACDAYITKWMAWAVQHPAERAQASVVFRGGRGSGKGTAGNTLLRIFGQHGVHISSANHLAGQFNSHLRDACLLFADESYWPGDRAAEGSLKRLITEPTLFIEGKGRDAVMVPNMLHVIMASNEKWIIPAGEKERRFAVFDVSEKYMQDDKWFDPLYDQLDNGGYSAMLFDLLRFDLGDFHPRQIVRTKALFEQQANSLSPEDTWIAELLEIGSLWGADPTQPNKAVSRQFERTKLFLYGGQREERRKGLFDQAREISPRLKNVSDHALGAVLSALGCERTWVLRHRGWAFPPLIEMRQKWEARFPGWAWHDLGLARWQAEPE